MDSEQAQDKSGATSPSKPETGSTTISTVMRRRRRDSQETIATSADGDISLPPPSITVPTVPVNSPQESVAGDRSASVSLPTVDLKLMRIPTGGFTPPDSEAGADEGSPRPTACGSPSEYDHVHEFATWKENAIQETHQGLRRIARAAKDHNKIDPTKSVEEHYGEILSKVLKEAEIKLDPKYLQ